MPLSFSWWVNWRHTHSSATRVLPFPLFQRAPDSLLEIGYLVSRTHWVVSTHLVSSPLTLSSLSHNNCFTLVTLRVVFSTATRMLYPQGFIVPLYRRCCESRCTISFRRGQLWDGVLSAEYKPLTRNLGCGKEPVESRNAQETSWRRSLMTRRWM